MRIYFMGICGTAMGNVALLMKQAGHTPLGCDSAVYPPMSEVLDQAGIEVLEGFDAERLASIQPDIVVVGNSMSRGNVEVEWLLNQSAVPYVSLPQWLHDMVLTNRDSIVIAGTHGKTTTSALTAYLLEKTGARPGWLIGGVSGDLPTGAHTGQGKAFVIEGDEYDSAFFDKRSKFIHYNPRIAVINNLEFDHADIFRDLKDVQRSFQHLLRIVPASGYVLINGDDENIAALMPVPWTRVIRIGRSPDNDLVIKNFKDGPAGTHFDLIWRGVLWTRISWQIFGLFNARNAAVASLAAALASGCEDPTTFDLSALALFRGVRRRQDILYADKKWIVLEDFAHHPSAVAATIEALSAAYPDYRMTICFEPRSNTAVSAHFQNEFQSAFSGADRVYLGAIYRKEKIRPENCLNSAAIASALPDSKAFDSNDALFSELKRNRANESGGLIVFLTNGSFDGIPKAFAGLFHNALKT